jgi:hypothetical protein
MTKEDLYEALREQNGVLRDQIACINEVRSLLEPAINSLMPIHATLDEFERGGPTCRKAIETIYDRLLQAERTIEDGYYDDD